MKPPCPQPLAERRPHSLRPALPAAGARQGQTLRKPPLPKGALAPLRDGHQQNPPAPGTSTRSAGAAALPSHPACFPGLCHTSRSPIPAFKIPRGRMMLFGLQGRGEHGSLLLLGPGSPFRPSPGPRGWGGPVGSACPLPACLSWGFLSSPKPGGRKQVWLFLIEFCKVGALCCN